MTTATESKNLRADFMHLAAKCRCNDATQRPSIKAQEDMAARVQGFDGLTLTATDLRALSLVHNAGSSYIMPGHPYASQFWGVGGTNKEHRVQALTMLFVEIAGFVLRAPESSSWQLTPKGLAAIG